MIFDFPKSHPHELILFFYPSPGLNWRNPKGLTWTTARNTLLGRPRSIGHVSIMVRSEEDYFLTGMTHLEKKEGQAEVLLKGYGLGILLHNFKGALETREALVPELISRSGKPGWLSYLRITTNEKINNRLREYVNSYRENRYDAFYGMNNRPLHGEGSGCSAFAASFLETAGILREEFANEWTREFNIPLGLVGGPATNKKVSLMDIILSENRWAHENEPHEKGFFWDPDLMHAWLLRTYEREIKNPTGEYKPEMWHQAPGLELTATGHTPPTGKIFKHL